MKKWWLFFVLGGFVRLLVLAENADFVSILQKLDLLILLRPAAGFVISTTGVLKRNATPYIYLRVSNDSADDLRLMENFRKKNSDYWNECLSSGFFCDGKW